MTAFTIQVPCGMPSDLRVLLRVRTQDHFTAQACAHAVARIAGVDIWTIWHLMCHCLDLMIWIAWHRISSALYHMWSVIVYYAGTAVGVRCVCVCVTSDIICVMWHRIMWHLMCVIVCHAGTVVGFIENEGKYRIRLDEGTKLSSVLPDSDIEILGMPPPMVLEPWKKKANSARAPRSRDAFVLAATAGAHDAVCVM